MSQSNTKNKTITTKHLSIGLLVFSFVALLSSFILTLERIAIYQNPLHVSSCDVSAVFSCGTVMRSEKYAEVFGFPNPLIGLIGFSVTLAIGAILYLSRKSDPLKDNLPFKVSLVSGMLLAFSFIAFLWFNTTFVINSLCIYCMIVWVCTTFMTALSIGYSFKFNRITTYIIAIIPLIIFFGIIAIRFNSMLFNF